MNKGTIGKAWNVYDIKTGKLLPIPKPKTEAVIPKTNKKWKPSV